MPSQAAAIERSELDAAAEDATARLSFSESRAVAEGAPDIVDVLLSRCAFHVDGRSKRVEWDRDPPVLASPPGSRM